MSTERRNLQHYRTDHISTDFSKADLEALRTELLQAGLDSWQAGELVATFLVARGFGVSAGDARAAATLIEAECCSLEYMRQELTRLAFVM